MEKIMKKKTVLYSIGIVVLFIFVSFTSAVGYHAVTSSQNTGNSPLYHLRLRNFIDNGKNLSLSASYIGKDTPVDIPLPIREILTEEMINQLSSETIQEKIRSLNSNIIEKWDSVLTIAQNNLAEINSLIRQDYTEFQTLVSQYYAMQPEETRNLFLEQIRNLDAQELKRTYTSPQSYEPLGNITSGPFCNITSGQLCQITTQPICQITSQPICSITTLLCLTFFGPLCSTIGIKCNLPTTHPKICSFLATAGRILKLIVLLLILAVVIFVPLGILSLVFITAVNPDRCTQIHDRITTWFNCTTPK